MSKSFPTNPDELIEAIQSDSPSTYDILREGYFSEIGEGSAPPTNAELAQQLENYCGDNWDVHYWYGRWSMMQELINPEICNSDNGTLHIAELLNSLTRIHYGYTLIRCEVCDKPHRLLDSVKYLDSWEVDDSDITDHPKCSCGQVLNHDHPDLFF